MSRNFDFSQAASQGVKVLPDLSVGLPNLGDVPSVKSIVNGQVMLGFAPPGAVAVGTGTTWARSDHVHPSDTSRLALTGGAVTGATSFSSTATFTGGSNSIVVNAPSGANPLNMSSVNGQNCLAGFLATSTRQWYAGVLANGTFVIQDANTPVNAIQVNAGGGTSFNGGQCTFATTSPVRFNANVGFNNTAPIAKPTISGACAGNTAIKALLTALASYGLVTDSTTA